MPDLIRRNYKYRIYPTIEQEKVLLRWEGILRFLWNLCHEQRLMGLSRLKGNSKEDDKRIFMKDIHKDKSLSQNKQMTDLLKEYPWIAEVQGHARQQILSDLDQAWQRVFKKLSYVRLFVLKPILFLIGCRLLSSAIGLQAGVKKKIITIAKNLFTQMDN